jgi:hypothetical protein
MASTFQLQDLIDIINKHKLASARVYAFIALLEKRRSSNENLETEITIATSRLKRDKAWTPRSDSENSSRVCDFVTELVSKYEFERKRERRKESRELSKRSTNNMKGNAGDPKKFQSEVQALLAGLPSS